MKILKPILSGCAVLGTILLAGCSSSDATEIYNKLEVVPTQTVYVTVPVETTVYVEVEKIVEVPTETIVYVEVEKEVIVETTVEVPVETTVYVEVEKTIEVPVETTVYVEVEKEIEVPVETTVYVEVEKTVEVEKEVIVEKEVEKIVYVEVSTKDFVEVEICGECNNLLEECTCEKKEDTLTNGGEYNDGLEWGPLF